MRGNSSQRRAGNAADERPHERDLRKLGGLVAFVRPYRSAVIGAVVALTVSASTVLVMGIGLRRLVDHGFRSGDAALLDHAFVILFGIIILLALATFGRYFIVSWLGERVVADIREVVFTRVVSLSPAYFEITKTGEILSRLTTDTTVIQVVIGATASAALRNLLLLLGGTILLIVNAPWLAGMVFMIVPVVVVPIVVLGRLVRQLSRTSQDRVAEVSAHVEESLNAVQTIQAFGHETMERRRFAAQVERAFAVAVRRIRARALLTALVILSVFGAVATVLWIGGHEVMSGVITPGELSAFVFYAVVVAASVGALSEVLGDLQRAAGAAERLAELLSVEPEIKAPAEPVDLPDPPIGRVAFENVTFHYPSRPDSCTLADFSLKVDPGQTVALVGPSGAGKSTVFKLLLRFYDPRSGRILIDGVPVPEAAPGAVRARIGLVPQDPVLFSADAWENIRYGRPNASDDEVRAAADAAAASEFLGRLPDGFASFLGEKGARLSAGQRQRIAIARSLLRNPPILLLDEATSALDAEREQAVQAALETLMAGRTTIVIAHRLATVLRADRIVVMDEGAVVATGTHAELIAQGGLYARLAALQFDADRVATPDPTATLMGAGQEPAA